MAYLCSMCVWCPQGLGELGPLELKLQMVVSHCVAAEYSPRATSAFCCCCCFLGQGFCFRPVLEATSALNHRADTTDLKIRISYQYLTSAQCSTSIFLIICVHVRDSRDRDYEGICRCPRGSQRTTSGSLYGQGRSLWCF